MSSTLLATIQAAIAGARVELGLTQQQLADRLEWSQATVWRLENGQRELRAHELPEVCAALEMGLLDLFARARAADKRRMRISRLYPSDEV